MEYMRLYNIVFTILAIYYQPNKILATTYSPSMTNSVCDGLVYKLANCSDDSMCPTWFTCTTNKSCHCGNEHKGEIMCEKDHHTSYVLDCYCVTYDDETRSTYVGACYYNCHHNVKYIPLPDSPK